MTLGKAAGSGWHWETDAVDLLGVSGARPTQNLCDIQRQLERFSEVSELITADFVVYKRTLMGLDMTCLLQCDRY